MNEPFNMLVDDSDVQKSLDIYRRYAGKTMEEAIRAAAKSTMERIIRYTPPRGPKKAGKNAKRALEQRITADYYGLFAPIQYKGKRAEKHPSLQPVLQQHPVRVRKGVARRPVLHQKAYVRDELVLPEVLKAHKRVGRLASGWLASANFLDIKVPPWIKRHGTGEGSVFSSGVSDDQFSIVAENRSKHFLESHPLIQLGIRVGMSNFDKHARHIMRGVLRRQKLDQP